MLAISNNTKLKKIINFSNELKKVSALRSCQINVGPTKYQKKNDYHYVGICRSLDQHRTNRWQLRRASEQNVSTLAQRMNAILDNTCTNMNCERLLKRFSFYKNLATFLQMIENAWFQQVDMPSISLSPVNWLWCDSGSINFMVHFLRIDKLLFTYYGFSCICTLSVANAHVKYVFNLLALYKKYLNGIVKYTFTMPSTCFNELKKNKTYNLNSDCT